MKSTLKFLLGPGMRADLRAVHVAIARILKDVLDQFKPHRRLRGVTGDRLLLNLGCGPCLQNGWVNLDMNPEPTAYFADFRDPLELKNGSVRHIHCEHVLEHLERDEAVRFLRECRRVLIEDGSLRLILPDAEKYLKAYVSEDSAFFESLRKLGNPAKPLTYRMAVINQMFRMGDAHRYAWDFEELRAVLLEVGFCVVDKSAFGDIVPDFRIDGTEDWRPHESLYVNAYCLPPAQNPALRLP